jgi:hypothetical protein
MDSEAFLAIFAFAMFLTFPHSGEKFSAQNRYSFSRRRHTHTSHIAFAIDNE